MNHSEFLESLSRALEGMREQDKQDALSYFDELISDKALDQGCSEEEAIADLGPIEEIAASIRQTEPASQAPQAGKASEQGVSRGTDESGFGIKTITAKAASVHNVVIQTANVPIELEPGSDDEIILEYTQDAYDIYDFSLQDGAMRLIRRPNEPLHMLGFFFQYRRSSRIKLMVPAEFAASCELSTSNSAITARDVSFWSWLKCKTSNSAIRLERLKAQGDLTAKTSNSSCTLENLLVSGKLQAGTSNSHLSAREVQAAEISLTTSNASLSARHLQSQGPITLESRNGRLEAEMIKTPEDLTMHTSNARISVQAIASPNIQLITSNGSVEGNILGMASEYSVTSHASSGGRDNLSSHTFHGPKRLEVKTSNASIQLRFTQDSKG